MERKVLRCRCCGLNQFQTRSGYCRRCSQPYIEPKLLPRPVQPTMNRDDWLLAHAPDRCELSAAAGLVVGLLQDAHNLSQARLAEQMGVCRQYIYKLLHHEMLVTASTAARLAEVFGITLAGFVMMVEIVAAGEKA